MFLSTSSSSSLVFVCTHQNSFKTIYSQVSPEQRKLALEHKSNGNAAFTKKKFYEAASEFTKAIDQDPYDHVFYSNRSACYAALDQHSKACADARRCVELKPDFVKGYSRLGFALYKSGFFHDSIHAYTQGLTLDPKNLALMEGMGEAKLAQKKKIEEAKLASKMNNATLDEYVIGIDLGTTYSCVSVWKDGEAHVLSNAEGDRTTASWVSFTEAGRVVGESAKRQASQNPKNTLFNIKRIIGRQFSEIGEDIQHMPFEIKEGPGGKPIIVVEDPTQNNEKKEFAPEQISAMVLQKMKATAEGQLGCVINKAVITVPAYFSDAQRRQTKDAGQIAGLEVLRIINEPTAAALAYGLDKREGDDGEIIKDQTILVFDLGGGTFDVSLLHLQDGVFEVLATAGDTHLGGEDFDESLMAHVQKTYPNADSIFNDDKSKRKLRTACEKAKRELSITQSAKLECFVGEHEVNMAISRDEFNKVNEATFQRCLEAVKRVLADAGRDKSLVNEIVLVGGSTRVPRVQEILTEYFDGKPLNKSVHPDEAVAYGAAVQGAILAGVRDKQTSKVLLMDVVPLSLGVECEGRHFAKVVNRNTSIPCKKKSEFTTVYDNQTEIDVRIFEGERMSTDGNHLLGEFQITGIEKAEQGVPKIDVTFEVNTNGLLTVTARDRVTGSEANVSLQHDRGRLTPEEIERMCAEAEAMREEDEMLQKQREIDGYMD